MANDVVASTSSLPLTVYEYTVTAITNVDGATANALTFYVPENFTAHAMLIFVVTQTTGTPQAGYASYNQTTLATVAGNGTTDRHVNCDVYVKVDAGTAAILKVYLY